MTAVIYARYSSDNQREESIEGQLRECTAFAEKNDITILRHYIDRAYSAKTDKRPEFQNMIRDSSKKLFDIILVWKLDRFARNRYDSARYKAQLKKNGVKVVSATEAISEGSEGIILEAVLEGFAEYYSADLGEKVTRGMTENALKCKYNGGTLPVGYVIDKDGHYQLDPLTAPFVLEAYNRYDDGATMKEIRDYLNEHRIKNTRGYEMNYNNVQSLLKNRKYIGEYSFRETVVPGGITGLCHRRTMNSSRLWTRRGNTDYAGIRMTVPIELLPRCPVCGKVMTTKLRVDDVFVGDAGWKAAANRYKRFLRRNEKRKVLYLELGVGGNTPVIIKYPIWGFTRENPQVTHVCVNYGEALCQKEIEKFAILIDGDIRALVQGL